MELFTLHFDGSCGPKNPGGTAAYGFVLSLSGQDAPVESGHGILGTGPGMTNNKAEFYALAMGLHAFYKHITDRRIPFRSAMLNVYGDSRLVINIMNRHWNAKPDKAYYSAYDDAAVRLSGLRRAGVTVSFDWIPREENQKCDDLSKVDAK